MKTPFTVDEFLAVFRSYNESVFPVQVIFYLFGGFVIYLTTLNSEKTGRSISGIIGLLWLWMGIVYHFLFFSAINPGAYIFGAMFILQGALFLTFGVIRTGLSFRFTTDSGGIAGMTMMLFALIGYPVLGYFNGHIYPASPTFGLPCPTTIFTFGLLMLADRRIPVVLLLIPFIWSIIGISATLNLGIKEDAVLTVSGVVSTAFVLFRNKSLSSSM